MIVALRQLVFMSEFPPDDYYSPSSPFSYCAVCARKLFTRGVLEHFTDFYSIRPNSNVIGTVTNWPRSPQYLVQFRHFVFQPVSLPTMPMVGWNLTYFSPRRCKKSMNSILTSAILNIFLFNPLYFPHSNDNLTASGE